VLEFPKKVYPAPRPVAAAALGGGNTQAADWDRAKARSLVGGVQFLHPPCWAGCKTPIFLWAYGPKQK